MSLIKKKKFLLLGLLIPYIFIYVICIKPTNYEVVTLGGLSEVEDIIEIDTDYLQEGSVNSIYVMTFQASIFQRFLADRTPKSSGGANSGYSYLTSADYDKMGAIQHNASVEYSLIQAYQAAKIYDKNIHLDYSFQGLMVEWRAESACRLKIGDIIVKINDLALTDCQDDQFITCYREMKNGSKVTVNRNGELIEYVFDSNLYQRIYVYPRYQINYESSYPKMLIHGTNLQGPSGGLLQSISVFNHLLPTDYTKGRKITGTGTIDNDGNVGPIGGITQKIYTAFNAKAKIFFCPAANYEEALKAYNSLNHKERMALVRVETFTEAIEYLVNA